MEKVELYRYHEVKSRIIITEETKATSIIRIAAENRRPVWPTM